MELMNKVIFSENTGAYMDCYVTFLGLKAFMSITPCSFSNDFRVAVSGERKGGDQTDFSISFKATNFVDVVKKLSSMANTEDTVFSLADGFNGDYCRKDAVFFG